jgi:hypothetical protein
MSGKYSVYDLNSVECSGSKSSDCGEREESLKLFTGHGNKFGSSVINFDSKSNCTREESCGKNAMSNELPIFSL